jgi:hypothetical protein
MLRIVLTQREECPFRVPEPNDMDFEDFRYMAAHFHLATVQLLDGDLPLTGIGARVGLEQALDAGINVYVVVLFANVHQMTRMTKFSLCMANIVA